MSDVRTLLEFLALAERLKTELRHSWLSDGRQESVAEHCWQMALMAMLVHPELEQPVDLGRTLRMILTHDLVEALTGDVPFFDRSERKAQKPAREQAAIAEIRARLGEPVGGEIHDLWQEFEAKQTPEAKFATALDHLEVQIQHNLAGMESWTRSSTTWSTPRWTGTAPSTRSSRRSARGQGRRRGEDAQSRRRRRRGQAPAGRHRLTFPPHLPGPGAPRVRSGERRSARPAVTLAPPAAPPTARAGPLAPMDRTTGRKRPANVRLEPALVIMVPTPAQS